LSETGKKVLALAGGVGGAKLAFGLARALQDELTVIVNTGDDFDHLGWHISPDVDTVVYTLAGIANKQQGWGLENETWSFMEQISRLGGPNWFKLGDRDIATHAFRTQRLREGVSLTQVTAELCRALGVQVKVVPMSDDRVRTIIHSRGQPIPFQEYFVRLQCKPIVEAIEFDGIDAARFNPALSSALLPGDVRSIVICPSNPYLSIDPILAISGARNWLATLKAPVVVVSPIVAGGAIKGPAAKIMGELGISSTATAVAEHYRGLAKGIVIDHADHALAASIELMGFAVYVTETVMKSDADRIALAADCLAFAESLAPERC
jgi:LPPG:FO 2-phospho-L-lactate transferase